VSAIQVVVDDLTGLAGALAKGANELTVAGPTEGQLTIDSGSADLDTVFGFALYHCAATRDVISADLAETSTNLLAVRDDYESSDWRVRELYDKIMDAEPLAER